MWGGFRSRVGAVVVDKVREVGWGRSSGDFGSFVLGYRLGFGFIRVLVVVFGEVVFIFKLKDRFWW